MKSLSLSFSLSATNFSFFFFTANRISFWYWGQSQAVFLNLCIHVFFLLMIYLPVFPPRFRSHTFLLSLALILFEPCFFLSLFFEQLPNPPPFLSQSLKLSLFKKINEFVVDISNIRCRCFPYSFTEYVLL